MSQRPWRRSWARDCSGPGAVVGTLLMASGAATIGVAAKPWPSAVRRDGGVFTVPGMGSSVWCSRFHAGQTPPLRP